MFIDLMLMLLLLLLLLLLLIVNVVVDIEQFLVQWRKVNVRMFHLVVFQQFKVLLSESSCGYGDQVQELLQYLLVVSIVVNVQAQDLNKTLIVLIDELLIGELDIVLWRNTMSQLMHCAKQCG
jgi:hypothetical protein